MRNEVAVRASNNNSRIGDLNVFADRFIEDQPAGKVIGSLTPDGVLRRGIDKEGVIGIDNGALRIQPLIRAGWGRAGLVYHPFERQNGLAFAVFMLNGHNTAQAENLPDTFFNRVKRWFIGSETYNASTRLSQWMRSKRKSRMIRQLRWWFRIHRNGRAVPQLDENLAVGWFPAEVSADPVNCGNTFVMHATGPENGELWARVGSIAARTVRGVQNLQIYYVVILRAQGAAYYIASVPNASGLQAYPLLRPVAVDPFTTGTPVYPGIYQSVLGQIGFRLDTRVYGTSVQKIDEASEWFGTAHAGDRLEGEGSLEWSDAEVGGLWRECEGKFKRCLTGVVPLCNQNVGIVDPGRPSGLIHVLWRIANSAGSVGLVWRYKDRQNYWRLLVDKMSCELSVKVEGSWMLVDSSSTCGIKEDQEYSLQVLDDGETMSFYVNGKLLFDTWVRDLRLHDGTGVGICAIAGSSELTAHSFEAHARTIELPTALRMGQPWTRTGDRIMIIDDFDGPAGDLAGRVTPVGTKMWSRDIGEGIFEITGSAAAKIRGSVQSPNPGRTTYAVAWDFPDFADLEVEITPPGHGRGQKEHGLCGFVFWQDADNYVTINIWVADSYGGASISCFFHLDGFEDLYDAIWSNVGKRIYWGVPLELRMAFDGMRYTVYINGEPVLFRSLTDVYSDCTRLEINRVGLLANWEWGNDTGSTFRNFKGRI